MWCPRLASSAAPVPGGGTAKLVSRTPGGRSANARSFSPVQSVQQKAPPLPAGGTKPAQSYYYNYIVFDTVAPLGRREGERQVYMRYLGAV